MAVLNKPWSTLERVSPENDGAVVTGSASDEGTESEGAQLLAEPLFIYVTDGAATEGFDKVEKVVLMDDKVCVGMHAFKCVKMTSEKIANDPLLADEGKDVPRFIFVSRDLEDIKVIEGSKMSSKSVFTTMKSFARKAYATKFEKNVKAVIKLLGEFDKINNERRLLAQKEEREEDPTEAEKKKFAKARAELDEREKEANEKRDELLKFELKATA